MEPNFPRARMVVWAYLQKGQFADALTDSETWRIGDGSPWGWAITAYVAGRSGDRAGAKSALEQLRRFEGESGFDSLSLAVAYIGMGDNDNALTWLEKASREHSGSLSALKVDPTYDPLRDAPRFQQLLRRIGLGNPPAS
jgi:FimV-like protein